MGRFSKVVWSAMSGDWTTPENLYTELDNEFHFDFDPCPVNPTKDMLKERWTGVTAYINPPYKDAKKWVKKAINELVETWLSPTIRDNSDGSRMYIHTGVETCVFLLPARTDTKLFHELIAPFASDVRFLKGRLRFSGNKNSAPFPSMVVVFKFYDVIDKMKEIKPNAN